MSNSEQVSTTEVAQGKLAAGVIPIGFKRAIQVIGLLLMIVGLPIAINLFCIVPLVSFSGSGSDATIYGVVSLTLALLTLGAGGVAYLHAQRSLHNKISKPLRLPSSHSVRGYLPFPDRAGINYLCIGQRIRLVPAANSGGMCAPASAMGSGVDDPSSWPRADRQADRETRRL